MYIFRSDNQLEIPISLSLFKGMAEEIVLVDSGTTENFINQEIIKKLKLSTKKLETPVGLRNIDRTFNKSGQITHYLDLLVSRGTKKNTKRFYVTDLGTDQLILSYPWLHTFNPDIDWPNCKLLRPPVKIKTLFYGQYPRLRNLLEKKWGVLSHTVIPTQDKPDQVNLVVRQTEFTEPEPEIADTLNNGHTEEDLIIHEAIEAVITENLNAEANSVISETFLEAREAVMKQQNPVLRLDKPKPKKCLEDIIPKWCHNYLDVFTEKEAIDLPPHRPWDHHVNLTSDAPPSISCRTYPLSRAEEEFQTKYIQEQLDAGLIRESKSPYATPVFYIKKKNESF
jgi:hypothetical protein